MNRKKNTQYFLFLLFLIIVISFLIQHFIIRKNGTTAHIQQNGTVVYELDLTQETELTLMDSSGGSNTIAVKHGSIAVTDANCPDLVCVHSGAVSHTGEVIACLPHKLIITISDTDSEHSNNRHLDSISW